MKEFIMENGERITIDEKELKKAAREARKREQKAKFKQNVENTKEWMWANREFILGVGLPILTVVTATVIKGVKVANRSARLKQEKDLKELYCYDRSLGHYWKLKRPLKSSDWVKIDARRRNGERLADILSDMKVIK